MEYAKVVFYQPLPQTRDLLIALLSNEGFEGFEEDENDLIAYVPADGIDKQNIDVIAARFDLAVSVDNLPSQNWNQLWESNFHPVVVDDFCTIRADFHQIETQTAHDIIITPKMSFGTGHHATTYMMISAMREINFSGKKVLDFGTGTGVLAILAAKLGAAEVLAIDNDEWSINNSEENIVRNNTPEVRTLQADDAALPGTYDVILANITRNVISANFLNFIHLSHQQTIILLSGLLEGDAGHIRELAAKHNLKWISQTQREKWLCIKLGLS